MKTVAFHILALMPTLASSFCITRQSLWSSTSTLSTSALTAKGFDKKKPAPKEKSAGQIEREKASSQYDKIAESGGQEYSVFVRQFGGEDKSWLPCGSIAVPRGAQVSDAIFGNEEALKAAIVRTFPKLQGFEAEFEYGYNLKIYPDDPVEVAVKNTKTPGISIGNWISALLSPVDSSKATPPS